MDPGGFGRRYFDHRHRDDPRSADSQYLLRRVWRRLGLERFWRRWLWRGNDNNRYIQGRDVGGRSVRHEDEATGMERQLQGHDLERLQQEHPEPEQRRREIA